MRRRTTALCAPTSVTGWRGILFSLAIGSLFAQAAGHAQTPGNALPYTTGYQITGNYVAAGVDLTPQQNPPDANGLATGTIHINDAAGDLTGADILGAFLYFETIHAPNIDPTAGIKFRGSTLTAAGLKLSTTSALGGNNQAQCWGAAGGTNAQLTMVRADVLPLLPKQFDVNGQWTGKRLVTDQDLANNVDFNGNPIPPHTVSLLETNGNLAVQSAGATLVVVYRKTTGAEPLRKIVFYDGVYAQPQGAAISETIAGFYKHAGNSARMTWLVGTGANNQTEQLTFNGAVVNTTDPFPQTSPSSDRSWANPTFDALSMTGASPSSLYGETVTTTLTQSANPYDCKAIAAIVFSTLELDADGDGLPDGVEDAAAGLHNPPTTLDPNDQGEPLPNLNAMGASSSHKDLFLEIGAMYASPGTTYGSTSAPISDTSASVTDLNGHNHMPTPDVLNMLAEPYTAHGINVHFDIGPDPGGVYAASTADPYRYVSPTYARGGEQLLETPCVPSATVQCQFPDYPGTVAWKWGFQKFRDAPVGPNGEELTAAEEDYCRANPTGSIDGIACGRRRFDRIRRSFFHYALYAHARARPKSPFPCLTVSDNTPAEYNNGACTGTLKDNPDFHVPKSISGTADLPGGNLMITLGLWESFLGTPFVQASTTLHELGHNFDLWHGGLPAVWGNKKLGTANYFEPNCKPPYLSSMSYLYQVHGLYLDDGTPHLDYSGFAQAPVNENTLGDGALTPAPAGNNYRAAWFVPYPSVLATNQGLSAASKFCSGSKFDPASPPSQMARAEADSFASSIDWNGDGVIDSAGPQNVNFDATFFDGVTGGVPIISSALYGFSDWDNIHLNQISAGRAAGRFAVYAASGSTFEGSTFEGSTFEGSTFEGSTFEGSTFEGSTFEGSTFEGSTFEGSTFEGQELDSLTAKQLGRAAPHGFTACVIGTTGCVAAAPTAPLHRVRTHWNASTFGHVAGYHVYRMTGTDPSTTVEVQGSPTTATSLVDPEELPQGVPFTYWAVAEFDDATPHPFSGKSNTATITAVNDAPAAVADGGYSTPVNTPLPLNLLANDTDADSPATSKRYCGTAPNLTLADPSAMCGVVVTATTTAGGTVTVSANGQTFTYTPPKNYTGPDSFTYRASGGRWSRDSSKPMSNPDSTVVATVSITVTKKK